MPHRLFGVLFAIVLGVTMLYAGESRMDMLLKNASQNDNLTCWVFFTDKGTTPLTKLASPRSLVSERSLQRRLHVLPADQLVDDTDLPIEERYVEQITALVTKVRQRSKWLNAVSVEATPEQIKRISELPFVKSIEPVARFSNRRSDDDLSPTQPSDSNPKKEAGTDSLNYGSSLGQLSLMNVPAIHNTGNSAQGILIGVFDNGVRLLEHQAFDSLRSRIVAMHDFVDNKTDVKPNNPSTGTGAHGVYTLSTIGGYRPGQLIGPAYGASYILARTENDSASDFYPSEEDNWIAAIEWAESLGVQVTSTSLGYYEHVDRNTGLIDTATSWKWYNMDGKTIPISRAATLAARKGVIVVNSAGNDASRGEPNTLVAPADADSIITVGAISASGLIAGFSSYGPTVDGRIKPDVVAQGVSVRCADPVTPNAYASVSGTSLSCPLVAGAAALVLKAHPTAKPMEIIRALKATANNAASPNNHYGWGLIDALAAINYLTPSSAPDQPGPGHNSTYILVQGNSVRYTLPEASVVTIRIYNILGQEIKVLLDNVQTSSSSAVAWDATSGNGNRVSTGVYLFRLDAKGVSGNNYHGVSKSMVLH